jgi:hypothetical protein
MLPERSTSDTLPGPKMLVHFVPPDEGITGKKLLSSTNHARKKKKENQKKIGGS